MAPPPPAGEDEDEAPKTVTPPATNDEAPGTFDGAPPPNKEDGDAKEEEPTGEEDPAAIPTEAPPEIPPTQVFWGAPDRVAVLFGAACDVVECGRLRGVCRSAAAAPWPPAVAKRLPPRAISSSSAAAIAATLVTTTPPSGGATVQRALAVIAAVTRAGPAASRATIFDETAPAVLSLFEFAAVYGRGDDVDALEAAVEVLNLFVRKHADESSDAASRRRATLVDAGLVFRAASALSSQCAAAAKTTTTSTGKKGVPVLVQRRRLGIYSLLGAVLAGTTTAGSSSSSHTSSTAEKSAARPSSSSSKASSATSLVDVDCSRVVAATLLDAKGAAGEELQEAALRLYRALAAGRKTHKDLVDPKVVAVLAAACREGAGAPAAERALGVLDALADASSRFLNLLFPKPDPSGGSTADGAGQDSKSETSNGNADHHQRPQRRHSKSMMQSSRQLEVAREDAMVAVIKNLYFDTSSKLALRVLCKLAHLGVDDFGVYADEDLGLVLAPAAHLVLAHVVGREADDDGSAVAARLARDPLTALFALNALRFLAHNGHAPAILEADPDAEGRLERVARSALDAAVAALQLASQGALASVHNSNATPPPPDGQGQGTPPAPGTPTTPAASSSSVAAKSAQTAAASGTTAEPRKIQLLRTVAFRAQALLQLLAL